MVNAIEKYVSHDTLFPIVSILFLKTLIFSHAGTNKSHSVGNFISEQASRRRNFRDLVAGVVGNEGMYSKVSAGNRATLTGFSRAKFLPWYRRQIYEYYRFLIIGGTNFRSRASSHAN